ncbi:MAG TPA: ABC transporter permease [Gemmatimonadaceae bacterium]|nr:ABC transporter permease [Gemmatimonadaceae bacterium]
MTPRLGSNWRRYLSFFGRRPERDVDDELAFHVQARVDEYIATGMDPEAARAATLVRLGDLTRYRGETLAIEQQEQRRRTMSNVAHSVIGDIRFGARQLGRNLPLTIAALLCFALGVGANTSIFSVVNAVLFRPLPFPDSDKLVVVTEGVTKLAADISSISAPDLLDYRETEGRAFRSLALIRRRDVTIAVNGEAEVIPGAAVTPSTFKVLRVAPAVGRVFLDADTVAGAPLVVVISDGLWRRRYGADRSMIGRQITLSSGTTAEVVGIMPSGFAFPMPGLGMPVADIFLPFRFSPAVLAQRADNFGALAIGRLQNGVSEERAESSLAEIVRQLPQRYPDSWGKSQSRGGTPLIHVKSMRRTAVGDSRRPLLVLLGAVGFVLLIACINVASLFIARASARKREIAIRRVLGATRGRLTQQFLAEALLLLAAGSVLGLIAAHWGTQALVALAPGNFYSSFDVSVDSRVLAFTGGLTVLTALVFAMLPGFHGRSSDAEQSLRTEGRSSTANRTRQRGRRVLIVTEVAFALMLTIGAGLMLRSLARVRAVNPGFDSDNLVTFNINLPATAYGDVDRIKLTERQIVQRLREIPGVTSASAASGLPMQGDWLIVFTPEGPPQSQSPVAANTLVLPGYFEAMRIPLRAGRLFSERDTKSAPSAVIINETLAREYYGSGNPIGRQFKWGPRDSPGPLSEIIGVVADVKQRSLDEEPSPAVYHAVLQQDTGVNVSIYRTLAYVVRTRLAPASVAAAIRTAVRGVDPKLVVLNVRPMDMIVGQTIETRRFNATLLGLFAALALALAATGVYGVLQYSVIQRRREMGIRIAIGATSSNMIALIVGQAVRLAAVGVAIGLAGAFALTRLIRALLFNTDPLDGLTFVASAGVLLVIAVLSSYLPARRALRIDPLIAMRAE